MSTVRTPQPLSSSSLLRPQEHLLARLSRYWRDGGPWGWLNAMAVSVSLLLMMGLVGLLLAGSLGHFWPSRLVEITLVPPTTDTINASVQTTEAGVGVGTASIDAAPVDKGQHLLGELMREEVRHVQMATGASRPQQWWLLQTSSEQSAAASWRWLPKDMLNTLIFPEQALALELRDGRVLYGMAESLSDPTTGELVTTGPADETGSGKPLVDDATPLFSRLAHLEGQRRNLAALRSDSKQLSEQLSDLMQQGTASLNSGEVSPALAEKIETARQALIQREQHLMTLRDALTAGQLSLAGRGGYDGQVALDDIKRVWQPNALGFGGRLSLTLSRFADFVSGTSNDGGEGAWPAIFGTVLMVVLMSVIVMPFGVMAALYLHEVAHQGRLTQLTRIALRNLAGVPSIVYGVFGLGFFVYGVGAGIDRLFYADQLPTPTFGTGGILWASLTLALLTLPVVIVATEEGLARVPQRLREGALALGATRLETLRRVIVPAASPALMTGLILAVARAAGEVAPLMLVGVVKLAPELPVDDSFPWLHLDRKFMHLGHQVYDLAFQSSDAFSNRPLVYATALVLVAVILCLNLSAIRLRHLLAQRYKGATE